MQKRTPLAGVPSARATVGCWWWWGNVLSSGDDGNNMENDDDDDDGRWQRDATLRLFAFSFCENNEFKKKMGKSEGQFLGNKICVHFSKEVWEEKQKMGALTGSTNWNSAFDQRRTGNWKRWKWWFIQIHGLETGLKRSSDEWPVVNFVNGFDES